MKSVFKALSFSRRSFHCDSDLYIPPEYKPGCQNIRLHYAMRLFVPFQGDVSSSVDGTAGS